MRKMEPLTPFEIDCLFVVTFPEQIIDVMVLFHHHRAALPGPDKGGPISAEEVDDGIVGGIEQRLLCECVEKIFSFVFVTEGHHPGLLDDTQEHEAVSGDVMRLRFSAVVNVHRAKKAVAFDVTNGKMRFFKNISNVRKPVEFFAPDGHEVSSGRLIYAKAELFDEFETSSCRLLGDVVTVEEKAIYDVQGHDPSLFFEIFLVIDGMEFQALDFFHKFSVHQSVRGQLYGVTEPFPRVRMQAFAAIYAGHSQSHNKTAVPLSGQRGWQ